MEKEKLESLVEKPSSMEVAKRAIKNWYDISLKCEIRKSAKDAYWFLKEAAIGYLPADIQMKFAKGCEYDAADMTKSSTLAGTALGIGGFFGGLVIAASHPVWGIPLFLGGMYSLVDSEIRKVEFADNWEPAGNSILALPYNIGKGIYKGTKYLAEEFNDIKYRFKEAMKSAEKEIIRERIR